MGPAEFGDALVINHTELGVGGPLPKTTATMTYPPFLPTTTVRYLGLVKNFQGMSLYGIGSNMDLCHLCASTAYFGMASLDSDRHPGAVEVSGPL